MELIVRMELETVDLRDVIPNNIVVQNPDPSPEELEAIRRRQLEFPLTLRISSLRMMNVSPTTLKKYRVATPQESNLSVTVGELILWLRFPESLLKNTCSDCGLPLSLFQVQYEWESTYKNQPIQGGRTGTWCPHCYMLEKELRPSAKKSLAKELQEIREGARKGWWEKSEKMIRREMDRILEEKLRLHKMMHLQWWEEQREKNTELYQEYLSELEA